jgi:23S rRNA (adenine2030-N6)-methyltransferase
MLSYRHGFHAGNHADVLKHAVFVHLLRHLAHKDKAFWCVDSHAGAAEYDLRSAYAQKHREYESGIARLWGAKNLPPLLADYVQQVASRNPEGDLRHYPGSPQLALQLLRSQDRLRLFELHSTESRELREYFAPAGKQVTVTAGDGFDGLKSVLPPPPRRGVILIDPSYEDRNDYRRVVIALREGLARFATGIYAVWYPEVQRRESQQLPDALMRLPDIRWLHVTLTVKRPQADGFGLHGSGMFVVNPPHTLAAALRPAMPELVRLLGQDDAARFELKTQGL